MLPERVAPPPRTTPSSLVQRTSATTGSTEPLVRRFEVLPALAIAIVPNIASRVAVWPRINDALLAEVFWVLAAPGKNGLSWSTPVNVAAPAIAGAPAGDLDHDVRRPHVGPGQRPDLRTGAVGGGLELAGQLLRPVADRVHRPRLGRRDPDDEQAVRAGRHGHREGHVAIGGVVGRAGEGHIRPRLGGQEEQHTASADSANPLTVIKPTLSVSRCGCNEHPATGAPRA